MGDSNSTDRFGLYDAANVVTLSGSVVSDGAGVARLTGNLGHFSLTSADNADYLVILAPQSFGSGRFKCIWFHRWPHIFIRVTYYWPLIARCWVLM